MTECTTDGFTLGQHGRRTLRADFDGGQLVTDAGLLLLRQVDQRLGLTEALTQAIHDPRDPTKVTHGQQAMLAQRVHAIAAGWEDLNDHQALRHDPVLQLCADVAPQTSLASPATLCRLENRVTRSDCVRLAEVLVDQFIARHASPPKELILDFDATDDLLHGKQEGRFYHGYYHGYCYLPLYVFCGDALLTAYLRPSNIDAAKHSRAVLKLLVRKLRAAWPSVRIVMRGDSGFCRWKLMRWCDRHDVKYLFGLGKNKALERLSEAFMRQAEADFEASGEKQRHFHGIEYGAKTWDRKRRVIVKAERLSEGPNLRFVVTNLDDVEPQPLYDEQYCARGEMENRIKEQQLGLFADRTSCSKMIANQFRLLLSSAAYVLLESLRHTVLAGTPLASAQVGTIRLKLLKVAARVQVSVRRVVLHLSSSYPLQTLFRELAAKLQTPAWHTG